MTNKSSHIPKDLKNKLSIQLSLNGFSFCVFNSHNEITFKTSELSKVKFSEFELLKLIEEVFEKNIELNTEFTNVEVTYQNELFALVPKEIFQEEFKSNYLNYSVKTLATDFIEHEEIGHTGIINVYIPYVNLNNFLIDKVGEFSFQHSSGVLIQELLNKETNNLAEKVHVAVSHQYFELIVTKGDQLLLFNGFNYHTNEDVLYYILFCMEQLQLDPNHVQLDLLNEIDSDLFNTIYTYVRNVNTSTTKSDELIHRIICNS